MEGTNATPQPLWIESDDVVQLDAAQHVSDPRLEVEAEPAGEIPPAYSVRGSRTARTAGRVRVVGAALAVAIAFGGGVVLAPRLAPEQEPVVTRPAPPRYPLEATRDRAPRARSADGLGVGRRRRGAA